MPPSVVNSRAVLGCGPGSCNYGPCCLPRRARGHAKALPGMIAPRVKLPPGGNRDREVFRVFCDHRAGRSCHKPRNTSRPHCGIVAACSAYGRRGYTPAPRRSASHSATADGHPARSAPARGARRRCMVGRTRALCRARGLCRADSIQRSRPGTRRTRLVDGRRRQPAALLRPRRVPSLAPHLPAGLRRAAAGSIRLGGPAPCGTVVAGTRLPAGVRAVRHVAVAAARRDQR